MTYRSKEESKYILPNFHSKRAQELAGALDCMRNLFQGREATGGIREPGSQLFCYSLEGAIWKEGCSEMRTPCSEHFVSKHHCSYDNSVSCEAGMFARAYWHARILEGVLAQHAAFRRPRLDTPGFQHRKDPAEEHGRWELSHRDGANAQSQSKAAKNVKF